MIKIVLGKYVVGGIFGLIGLGLIGLSPIVGFLFIALAIYFFTKGDKESEEKNQERRVRMKERELKEKELNSKIKKLEKSKKK